MGQMPEKCKKKIQYLIIGLFFGGVILINFPLLILLFLVIIFNKDIKIDKVWEKFGILDCIKYYNIESWKEKLDSMIDNKDKSSKEGYKTNDSFYEDIELKKSKIEKKNTKEYLDIFQEINQSYEKNQKEGYDILKNSKIEKTNSGKNEKISRFSSDFKSRINGTKVDKLQSKKFKNKFNNKLTSTSKSSIFDGKSIFDDYDSVMDKF